MYKKDHKVYRTKRLVFQKSWQRETTKLADDSHDFFFLSLQNDMNTSSDIPSFISVSIMASNPSTNLEMEAVSCRYDYHV